MMMQVVVSGCFIHVDGIQFGPKYSTHNLALNEAKKIHDKHYPQAKFIDKDKQAA